MTKDEPRIESSPHKFVFERRIQGPLLLSYVSVGKIRMVNVKLPVLPFQVSSMGSGTFQDS